VAAVRRLERRSVLQATLAVVGSGIAAYVLYRNVWPVPAAPFRYFPYGVLAWLLVGLLITLLRPGFVASAARGLERRTDEPEPDRQMTLGGSE